MHEKNIFSSSVEYIIFSGCKSEEPETLDQRIAMLQGTEGSDYIILEFYVRIM